LPRVFPLAAVPEVQQLSLARVEALAERELAAEQRLAEVPVALRGAAPVSLQRPLARVLPQ